MPAYNAAQTLVETYQNIPAEHVDKVILVDDGSIDDTARVAQTLDLELIVHPHNAGYGANQKTCYMEALRQGADVVIMLHPDGQYDPEIIPDMINAIWERRGDFVMGSRFLPPENALQGGMPRYKFLANRFLTAVENLVMGTKLSECHTGYRAYSRRLLETVPFLRNSNGFVFDTEMIFQANHFGFHFAEVPVSTRYFNEASSISFTGSTVYGLKTLWVAGRYLLHRLHLWQFDLFKAAHRGETTAE
ncbi:MAG: glycosyltransferase family 2 protein [Ardenticatenaceae bacterium]|nr:glycosyltransferase family 2 protein [Ardenticatenaceae bacterium]MCB9005349.1 glycosyltransferase family 2 protein [Ardenticatenaceae bacterium]